MGRLAAPREGQPGLTYNQVNKRSCEVLMITGILLATAPSRLSPTKGMGRAAWVRAARTMTNHDLTQTLLFFPIH